MSFIGNVELKSSDIRKLAEVTGSTSATHTLTWTPPNVQSLIVTINGVTQQDNYTVSGTTLTLDTALITTDKMEVMGINDIGTTITPAQGSVNTDKLADDAVATAKIQDDAVTADKLANAINTSIAANTAKVTNATHTGDVTGATALTIATDAVDIAMLSATGTADATTFLRGDNAWASAGGDNTPSFQARNTSTQSSLTSNTLYKVEYNTEDWDTDSAYDHTTNYRFTVPAGEGGKYQLDAEFYCITGGSGYMRQSQAWFYLNGSASNYGSITDWRSSSSVGIQNRSVKTSAIMDLSATDYIEIYGTIETQSGTWDIDNNRGKFSAFKLIGV